MILRNWYRLGSPSADAASCCPWSTERMPARTISPAKAASFRLMPTTAIARSVASRDSENSKNAGPKGTPTLSVW
ncbi:hypothetical protein GCM10025868_05950 [Angustibacter aerolatus]|uniref:Uncharacterized protein n=1 Tax=Angustibacter aerolatus TaxID=1162965 RepID=A0ABQ6JEU3_9ACTN|nr:hypothetical protein GCM10025868_05950 [Angustibacter aerolatus]